MKKVLITGPAGAGKTHFSKRYEDVVHLDDYRKNDGEKSVFIDVPMDKYVYEGSIASTHPLVRELNFDRIILVKAPWQSFIEANRLKFEAKKEEKDFPLRWLEYFKRMAEITPVKYNRLYANEFKWWKQKWNNKEIEMVVTSPFSPTKAWDEKQDKKEVK